MEPVSKMPAGLVSCRYRKRNKSITGLEIFESYEIFKEQCL